ncbi:MAG: protein kinase [Myxococcaceae bacterium]|nr:protein kinase [Myxococcaceae bacterium]
MEGHLDPAAFHGFVAGTLTAEERSEVVAHLDGCSRCRKLMSALAGEAPLGDELETLQETKSAAVTTDLRKPAGTELVPPLLKPRKLFGDDTTSPDSRPLLPTQPSQAVPITAELDRSQPPPPPLSDRLVGQKLGDYVVTELIAKGGMGAVYRGVQPVIGKQVAIKVLLTPGPTELNYAERMLEEARTVNAIGHANIIDIFNFGELPDGRPWLVMEYLDGLSVSQWVRAREQAPPPIDRILSVLDQICAALEAVHAVGVVHRDLKPANIMLTSLADPVPRVKVLDFGFAKSRDATIRTSPDMVLGTPGYMSPEQIQALGATPRSDLYALGLVAWYMVMATDAYQDKSPITVLQMQLQREPPSLAGRSEVPGALAELIADLTRIDPALRPSSAQTVRARLRAIANGLGLSSGSNDAVTQRDSHPPAPELMRTEPDRPSVPQRRDALEAAVDGVMNDLSKSQVRATRPSVWPWIIAVGGAVALGLGTWLALR